MTHSRAEGRLVRPVPSGPQLPGERPRIRARSAPIHDPGADSGPDGSDPAPEARTWVERDAAVVWHGFTQMAAYAGNAPLVIDRAEGRELIDADGRRYLDAISSLWVNTLGHRVPELDAALAAQAGKVAHSTMLGNGNTVVVELAEALAPVVPVDDPHFLFAADGAVAVEQALKIAFQYWVNRGVDGRTRFLALGDAYHGDTIGSLSLGDGGVFSAVFDPLCFPVVRTPGYADPGWADKACAAIEAHGEELAAVVIEPLVQGASGMLCASASDVRRLGEACRQAGTLLICDEVATGFGRTGTLFASEQCGLRPDLMCVGKGITGGYLAMSATVASGEVFGAFLGADLGPETFYHGHSYGGNALAAAVALEHLRLFEAWDVLGNVRARADQLASLLGERVAGRAEVREIRQRGLMVGIELEPPSPGLRWGRRVCAGAVARGVLLRPLGDVVVLMPPLTTTAEEIVRIVDALDGGLDDLTIRSARPRPRPHDRLRQRRGTHASGPPWIGSSTRAAGAPPASSTPSARRACSRGRAGAGGLVRVQRLSRIERASGRGGGRPRGAHPLGRRLRRLAPGHRQPPHPQRARAGAGRVEGDRGCRLLPDRVRRQPRRAVHAGRPGRAHPLGRAEPRQHHRRVPALPLSPRRLPPP